MSKPIERAVFVRFDADEWKFIHQIRNVLFESSLEKMTISEFVKEACMKTLVESATNIKDAVDKHPELEMIEEGDKIQLVT
jgi:hypothetical protein